VAFDIECRATDVNLNPASLKVEIQIVAGGAWQPVLWQPSGSGQFGSIQARCHPAPGARPLAIRATIADRAGNSTVYQTQLAPGPLVPGPPLSQSASAQFINPFAAVTEASGGLSGIPAIAPTSPTPQPLPSGAGPVPPPANPPTAQSWPAGEMARAPFQLWSGGISQNDDGVTAYGNPLNAVSTPATNLPTATNTSQLDQVEPRLSAQYATTTKNVVLPSVEGLSSGWSSSPGGPQFAPLEPFRQAMVSPILSGGGDSLVPVGGAPTPVSSQSATPIAASPTPPTHRPPAQPKLVGSRTFSLEYDLDTDGRAGVARVELWGTRDGGQSWNRFVQDDDNRSPLVVTVDDEGLYGFKIVVQDAGSAAANTPSSGEEPELWVAVDLKRPIIEITAIERGEGNLADHLILRWRAQDNNLEQRPISLYFSSRSSGPWSAIATNLEDTGQYAWRVERYIPTRIYLRIEARDTAGNLAAYQTREPLECSPLQLSGQLRSASPVGSSSAGAVAAPR
jgi:hypothetical protein